MKLAEKLLKHLVPFWWGQPGTTPGNGIHGDERILSSMPLNQWEKWEVGTAALLLLPLFTCLNNYSDGYINSIWHQSQRATRHWKRLLVEVCEAPSSEVLMSRLAGIRKGVSQQSTGLQTIWPKQHFVPSPITYRGCSAIAVLPNTPPFKYPPVPSFILSMDLCAGTGLQEDGLKIAHTNHEVPTTWCIIQTWWLWPTSDQNLQHLPSWDS